MLYKNPHELRNIIKHIRGKLSTSMQSIASIKIHNKILQLANYINARQIALYFAINGEANLNPVWNTALLDGKQCYFPALQNDKTLIFLRADQQTLLKLNIYKIFEPDMHSSEMASIMQLDILCIPVVAFDNKGTRLGMGGGYYDRTLSEHRPKLLLGVAYDFQFQPYIMRRAWDVPLDAVVTPTTMFYWNRHTSRIHE